MLKKIAVLIGVVAVALQGVGIALDVNRSRAASGASSGGHTLFLVGLALLAGAAVLFLVGLRSDAGRGRLVRVVVPIVPVAMVGVGMWAASSGAVVPEHVHASTAATKKTATRCDVGFNTAAFNFSIDAPTEAHAHSHGATAAAGSAQGAAPVNPDDTGHGGHEGPQGWNSITSKSDCDRLQKELDVAKAIAEKYPTIADAVEGGWHMVVPYVPKIGAHYMRFEYVDGEFNINEPEMLLYGGNSPESGIVGLSYYIVDPGPAEPSAGFTGNNDHYHRHVGLCLLGTLVIGPESMPKEACEAIGGKKSDGSDRWMSHVWVVPGCESDWGVFSGDNPALTMDLVTDPDKASKTGCGTGKKPSDPLTFQKSV